MSNQGSWEVTKQRSCYHFDNFKFDQVIKKFLRTLRSKSLYCV